MLNLSFIVRIAIEIEFDDRELRSKRTDATQWVSDDEFVMLNSIFFGKSAMDFGDNDLGWW